MSTQITRDHPDYDAVTGILWAQPGLVMLSEGNLQGPFIRVSDERAWWVTTNGKRHLEVEVFALDPTTADILIEDGAAVIEPNRRPIYID